MKLFNLLSLQMKNLARLPGKQPVFSQFLVGFLQSNNASTVLPEE